MKNNYSRADSVMDNISRSHTASKTGDSTIESDKLTSILKSKEDHIRQLMQDLKGSVQNFNQGRLEEEKTTEDNYDSAQPDNEASEISAKLDDTHKRPKDLLKDVRESVSTHRGIIKKEQTPEFCGTRGLSIDSLRKIDSLGFDNSMASEEFPRECRKCSKKRVIFLALIREMGVDSENELLDAVMNMKYDLQGVEKVQK